MSKKIKITFLLILVVFLLVYQPGFALGKGNLETKNPVNFILEALKKVWQEIVSVLDRVGNWLKDVWERFKSLFSQEFKERKEIIKEEFPKEKEEVKKELPGLWQRFKGLIR